MFLRGLCMALLLTVLVACGERRVPSTAALVPDGQPERIVTLSPNLAELAFAAGAGERVVGVSAYSNYPEAVKSLPVVGDAFQLDHERLVLLHPDLLLAWQSGTPAHIVDELRQRGYRVVAIRTRNIADIPRALRQIGQLAGSDAVADAAANAFNAGIERLRRRWQGAEPIRVFYQISTRPLYTVNGDHYVSELIDLCGGRNVFADLDDLAPLISEEAVLERNPEVLLAAGLPGSTPFSAWERWPQMAANRYDNRFLLPADEIGRATGRLLVAGEALCEALATGRRHRAAAGNQASLRRARFHNTS